MVKLIKVEASLATIARNRKGDAKVKFNIYDRKTNATIHTSETYSNRSNAKRGAERYCSSQGYAIALWVK